MVFRLELNYGCITSDFSTHLFFSSGINIFLDGFVPTENLRFRETSLVFKVSETANEEEIKRLCRYEYGKMSKKLGKLLIKLMLFLVYT